MFDCAVFDRRSCLQGATDQMREKGLIYSNRLLCWAMPRWRGLARGALVARVCRTNPAFEPLPGGFCDLGGAQAKGREGGEIVLRFLRSTTRLRRRSPRPRRGFRPVHGWLVPPPPPHPLSRELSPSHDFFPQLICFVLC